LADASEQGAPKDYAKSGYDLGHMAPNEDFAWDAGEQKDTFSMANVAPQVPGLNRQGWERLEEDVRAWALTRGELQVYVGPIYGETSKTIGADKLPIPSAFYKIVLDRQTGEEVGFIMPNKPIKKGAAQPWHAAIATIEDRANISLPRPPDALENSKAWPADLVGWRRAHNTACKK
jgi:endonuclease G